MSAPATTTTTAAAKAAAPRRMTIGSIQKAAPKKPAYRVLVYGPEGVGKSTFAAGAPAPVFISPSKAIEQLGVAAFPQPSAAREIREAIAELETADHAFETVVLDELGWIEQLIWQQVCAAEGVPSIEAIGYGKGFTAAFEVWRVILADLERLQAKRGMHVVLLGHCEVKAFSDPQAGGAYDRFRLQLHEKASGMLRQWVAAMLFARYELHTSEKRDRMRALSSGARVLHTEWSPAFDAKNRYGLPTVLPMSWTEFEASAIAGAPSNPDELRARIDVLRQSLAGHLDEARFAAQLARAGDDAAALARIADLLDAKASCVASSTTTNATA